MNATKQVLWANSGVSEVSGAGTRRETCWLLPKQRATALPVSNAGRAPLPSTKVLLCSKSLQGTCQAARASHASLCSLRHNDNKTFLVWVNEEDHLRVISMQKGGNMKEVFRRFCVGLQKVSQQSFGKSMWGGGILPQVR